MNAIWIVLYVLLVAGLLAGAALWARKKKREMKDPMARRNLGPAATFLVKDLPPDWYVSLQFCIGFALAGLVAVLIFKSI